MDKQYVLFRVMFTYTVSPVTVLTSHSVFLIFISNIDISCDHGIRLLDTGIKATLKC